MLVRVSVSAPLFSGRSGPVQGGLCLGLSRVLLCPGCCPGTAFVCVHSLDSAVQSRTLVQGALSRVLSRDCLQGGLPPHVPHRHRHAHASATVQHVYITSLLHSSRPCMYITSLRPLSFTVTTSILVSDPLSTPTTFLCIRHYLSRPSAFITSLCIYHVPLYYHFPHP